jgi:leucine-zipper of insertion element IS481
VACRRPITRPEVLVSHRNARTTFHGRMLIVERFSEGWAKAHIAVAMGISRKCVRTRIARYEAEGKVGLHDRSSRPHTMPTRTPAVVEDQIMALRRVQRCGPMRLTLSWALRPARCRGCCAAAVRRTCATATQ